jgi:hypothetical protein
VHTHNNERCRGTLRKLDWIGRQEGHRLDSDDSDRRYGPETSHALLSPLPALALSLRVAHPHISQSRTSSNELVLFSYCSIPSRPIPRQVGGRTRRGSYVRHECFSEYCRPSKDRRGPNWRHTHDPKEETQDVQLPS